MMKQSHRADRNALLISICVHILVLTVLSVFQLDYRREIKKDVDRATLDVDMVRSEEEQSNRPSRLLTARFPTRKTIIPPEKNRRIAPGISSPSVRRSKESNAKIDEVIEVAPTKLTESATRSEDFPDMEMIPEVDTVAKLKSTPDFAVPVAVSTPTDVYPAKGIKSTRQVVSGKEHGGLSYIDSYGTYGTSDGGAYFSIGGGLASGSKRNIQAEWEVRDGLVEIVQQILPGDYPDGSRDFDVIFLLDASGSMKYIIGAVLKYIDLFIRNLGSKGVDYSLGLVSFVEQDAEVDISALGVTLDVNAFKGWLRGMVTYGGGDVPEPSLDALVAGLEDISFRPGANKVFVLYTDAPPHGSDKNGNSVADVLNALIKERVVVHVVSSEEPSLQKIASQTGGTWRRIPEHVRPGLGEQYRQEDMVKLLPTLDPDLEFLINERNKRRGLPPRDVLLSMERYAYDGDMDHKPCRLSDVIFGMVRRLGYELHDSIELSPDNNGNYIAEAGETIALSITLKNTVGNINAEDVAARLELENAEDSEYITILSGQSSYGTIPAGKTSTRSDCKFSISHNFKRSTVTFILKTSGLVYSTSYDLGLDTIAVYVKQ
jgi:Mg-chelatase subunit ChlD